jgi:hypothetical protein
MTLGTVLFLVALTPPATPLPCLGRVDQCGSSVRVGALWYFDYFVFWFSVESVAMGIAVAFLYLGRDKLAIAHPSNSIERKSDSVT